MPASVKVSAEENKSLLVEPYLDEGLRVEVVTITPERAAQWLKRNHVNRALKRAHVATLTRAIKAGAWDDVNGATIVFSDQHDLMDGQHRLQAVVEAQTPITTLVVFGVKAQKRATIDTGASRKLADYLSMHRHANAVTLAATMTMLYYYEQGNLMTYTRGSSPFATYAQSLEFLSARPTLEDSVTRARRLPRLMRPGHLAVLDYLFRQKNPACHEAWHTTMATGVVTPPYQAFLTLRERLIRDKTEGRRRHTLEHFVFNVRAWNAARKGQPRSQLRWGGEGENIPAVL